MRHEIACVERMFLCKDYPSLAEVKKCLDHEARILRRKGYIVECRRWDFGHLRGEVVYTLEAARPVERQIQTL